MDHTLLSTSSGLRYVNYLWRRRMIGLADLAVVFVVSAQYSLGVLDFPRAMARLSRAVKGGDAEATRAMCDRWFEEDLREYIAPTAVARVRQHQDASDLVYLLSASTQFAVGPVARHLGLPYRCTELEIVDRRFTGGIVGPACYGEGKRYWAGRLAQQHGLTLDACTFYSDSYTDRNLMEAVGKPVAVNPDRRLRALAQANGWPVECFY